MEQMEQAIFVAIENAIDQIKKPERTKPGRATVEVWIASGVPGEDIKLNIEVVATLEESKDK